MPESQNSGFVWEDDILTNVFQVTRGGYTDLHDCPKERNRFDSTENISIKTTGSDTLYLSDALRVYDYDSTDKHTAIVVRYNQSGTNKKLSSVYELNLGNREILFGRVTRDEIVELVRLIRSVPAGVPDPILLKEIHSMKKDLNSKSGVVQFNPKLDSKTQRRLQCSIPKFSTQKDLVLSHSSDPIVRGIPIREFLVSGRRVRNARV
jgi:hypothetical protein